MTILRVFCEKHGFGEFSMTIEVTDLQFGPKDTLERSLRHRFVAATPLLGKLPSKIKP